MKTYTITRLFDVRAWRKVEMQFPDDAAAFAHVEGLAAGIRAGGDIPRGHSLEDASNQTEFDVQGRESFFLDVDDGVGCADEVACVDAYTGDETAAEKVLQMRDALEAAEHWLAAEAESPEPGAAKPDEILRVIRAALAAAKGIGPDAADA